MMKLDKASRRDWQGFTRILEIMSFVDEIEDRSPGEVMEAVEGFCELPANPGQSMSMEEVVFWAGASTGMEYARYADEGILEPGSTEKLLVFSSIFAHSMKNAIVDLALGDIEAEDRAPRQKLSHAGQ